MAWYDFYKIFTYAFTNDPLTAHTHKDPDGAGVTQPDAIPDIRAGQDGSLGGGRGAVRLRDTNDFVDLSTVTNRIHRYKEYERLRNMAEIEMAMTVFADEACLAGNTKVATLHGFRTIKELSETEKERFLVYCFDFDENDYTLGWAFNPRKTKHAMTVKITLDDGSTFICTPDHRILLRNSEWIEAGSLQHGSELMPFYRLSARQEFTKIGTNQFPRIWTHDRGWIHERQFIDEWTTGQTHENLQIVNQYCRMIVEGLNIRQIAKLTGNDFGTIKHRLEKAGFSNKEMKWLGKRKDRRRVVGIQPWKEIDVFDLSVEKYKNFCTDWGVVHNCQRDDDGRVFTIKCSDQDIQDELEWLCFHRTMLNFDQKKTWNTFKQLCINGDFFWEALIDIENPKSGIIGLNPLPAETIYRIETTKGKLVEFQQSKEGPDYESLARVEVTQATEADLQQSKAIRFAPEQIIHVRIGDDRKTFYPYGVSLIEAARGPAHQLRLMEDAMVVYRLCLVGDTRIRTPQGYKYIKDINENDVVLCYNQNRLTMPTRVLKFMDNGTQDVLRVRSKHVELIGTKTHPVLVSRDGIVQYIDMQDLIPSKDRLILTRNNWQENIEIPRILGDTWAKLSVEQRELFRKKQYKNKSCLLRQCHNFGRAKQFLYAKGKSLPYKKAVHICNVFGLDPKQLILMNKGECNSERINLPKYVDEDFARFFGFLCGDGNIHNDNQLNFATSEDNEINRHYSELMERYFGKVRFELDKRSKKGLGKYVVDNTTACRILLEMGYINNHKINRIPSWVFQASPAIRRAFAEGLSDADGCERHTKKGTWFSTIELCNKRLVEDIKELWSSIGLCSGHIKTRTRVGGHEIESGRIMPPTISHSVMISDCLLPETEYVLNVIPFGSQNVYDVTVENECHNFIANGVPVHNTRAPERRVFYIDVQQLPPYKAEAFVERMKDKFKKKKVASNRSQHPGASSVEERWHAPAADEDYWIPIRPNANTRVETLPGAQNLGEIDDTVYFRNKLFTALNFPRNYFNNEDTQSTRIALSAQDIKFARMIERLQSHFEDALWEVCDRHLHLLGFPEDAYEDLEIKMTPPSDWRELTRAEVITNRLNNAANLKGSQLMSDFDILTKWMKYSEDEANVMLARLKIQKLEELKLQIIAQNPTLLGVGLPGPEETEIGIEPGGPSPMLGDQMSGQEMPQGMPGQPQGMPPGATGMRKYMDDENGPTTQRKPPVSGSGNILPEPSEEDIIKYDLEINDFSQEMDEEEIDRTEDE